MNKLSKSAARLEFYLSLQEFMSAGPPTIAKVRGMKMPGLLTQRQILKAIDELQLHVERRQSSRGVSQRVV